jgi:hypothetical protein
MAVIITGNNTPTAGGITYGDGTTYANTAAGTSGQLLQSNGASAPVWATVSSGFTLGTPTDLSAGTLTSVDYTGIPSGVKQIIISFNGVGTDTSSILVQIGDAGGIESTSYVAGSFRTTNVGATSTEGFPIYMILTSNAFYGQMVLMLENSATNYWISSHSGRITNSAATCGGGSKSLTATLDRLRITTANGTDLFDAGEVNIAYL